MNDIRLKFKIDTKDKFDILDGFIYNFPPNVFGKEGEIACIKRIVGSKIFLQIRCCVKEGTKWYDCPVIYDGWVNSNNNKILTYSKKDIKNLQNQTDLSEEYLSRYDESKDEFVFDVFPLIFSYTEYAKTGCLKWNQTFNKLEIDINTGVLSLNEELDGDTYLGTSLYQGIQIANINFGSQTSINLNPSFNSNI